MEAGRAADRAAFESERLASDADKDRLLRALLADKIAEQQRLEARIAAEQDALQAARMQVLYGGSDLVKLCRGKDKQHVVRVWVSANDRVLHWAGKGLVGQGSTKGLRLSDVTALKLGQATPAFERPGAASIRTPFHAARSLSLVTPQRSLDLVLPSDAAFTSWVEGLKPLLAAGAGAGGGHANFRLEELRPGMAAAQAQAKRKLDEEARARAQAHEQLMAAAAQAAQASAAAAAKRAANAQQLQLQPTPSAVAPHTHSAAVGAGAGAGAAAPSSSSSSASSAASSSSATQQSLPPPTSSMPREFLAAPMQQQQPQLNKIQEEEKEYTPVLAIDH